MKGTWQIGIEAEACKGCLLCIAECRHDVLHLSEERNRKGYLVAAADRPEACVGCRLCEWICPEMAIDVSQVALSVGGGEQ